MRRTLALVAATAVLGGATAGLAVAAPSTLKFTTRTTSPQNAAVTREDVLQGGKKIGTDTVACKQTGCKVRLVLAKGTIRLTFNPTGNSGPLHVVGGTGAYKGATGTGAYRSLNQDGSRTAVTLRLS
jgi:hypothetical protein